MRFAFKNSQQIRLCDSLNYNVLTSNILEKQFLTKLIMLKKVYIRKYPFKYFIPIYKKRIYG